MAVEQPHDGLGLVHPIYLDVPMMVSFVAALEGGYAMENVLKVSKEASGDMSAEASGELGASPILANLVKASLKGSSSVDGRLARSEESQIVLKHTEASIFMRLRRELHAKNAIHRLDTFTESQWASLQPSSFVEMSGYVLHSPITELIRLAERIVGVLKDQLPWKDGQVDMERLTDEHREAIKFINLVSTLRADMDSSPLSDMVMQQEGGGKAKAVLDISPGVLPINEQEKLICGRVTVLGKATRVLRSGENINVYRRSLFGYMPELELEKLQNQVNETGDLRINIHEPTVTYPAIEILPMAIYV